VMDQSAEDIKEHLMRTSEEFRHLADQHHSLKRQVAQLEGKSFLNEQEEIEEQRLKKLKLHIKDQMEAMINDNRPQAVTSAV
jgi:uncharacterized protein YdcH (DUF465 family)